MADNDVLPATGDIIRSVQRGGAAGPKSQVVILDLGPAAGAEALASGTVPVSATALPLPTGAALDASLASILVKMAASPALDASVQAVLAKLPATPATNTPVVSGSVSVSNLPATQPVSAASLPLPTGAALDSSLASILAKQPAAPALDGTDGAAPAVIPGTGIRGWLRSIFDKLNGTLAVSGTFWQATQPVSGNVGVTALPAIPAGANAIGSVSVSNLPATQTVRPPTSATQGTAPLSAAVTTADTVPVAANAVRKRLIVANDHATAVIYLNPFGVAAVSGQGVRLGPGVAWDDEGLTTGAIHAIGSAACNMTIAEFV